MCRDAPESFWDASGMCRDVSKNPGEKTGWINTNTLFNGQKYIMIMD